MAPYPLRILPHLKVHPQLLASIPQVDTGPLMEAFNLHPYDNLLPQEEYERQADLAYKSIRAKKVGRAVCARP